MKQRLIDWLRSAGEIYNGASEDLRDVEAAVRELDAIDNYRAEAERARAIVERVREEARLEVAAAQREAYHWRVKAEAQMRAGGDVNVVARSEHVPVDDSAMSAMRGVESNIVQPEPESWWRRIWRRLTWAD